MTNKERLPTCHGVGRTYICLHQRQIDKTDELCSVVVGNRVGSGKSTLYAHQKSHSDVGLFPSKYVQRINPQPPSPLSFPSFILESSPFESGTTKRWPSRFK